MIHIFIAIAYYFDVIMMNHVAAMKARANLDKFPEFAIGSDPTDAIFVNEATMIGEIRTKEP